MSKRKDLTFAEARRRLDEILDEVEQEGGDVDQLAARVREAAELIRFCRDRLAAARHEVTQVVTELTAVEQSVAQEAGAVSAPGDADQDAGPEAGDDEDVGDGPRKAPGRRTSGGELPF